MVLYVLQWKVGFNLTDEASPPKLFPSRCTYSMGKSYSTVLVTIRYSAWYSIAHCVKQSYDLHAPSKQGLTNCTSLRHKLLSPLQVWATCTHNKQEWAACTWNRNEPHAPITNRNEPLFHMKQEWATCNLKIIEPPASCSLKKRNELIPPLPPPKKKQKRLFLYL